MRRFSGSTHSRTSAVFVFGVNAANAPPITSRSHCKERGRTLEFFEYISDIMQNFIRIVQSIGFFDILDILLLTIVIFYLLKLTEETRAKQLLKGIVLLIALYVVVQI